MHGAGSRGGRAGPGPATHAVGSQQWTGRLRGALARAHTGPQHAPRSESRGHRSDPRGSTEVGTQGRLPITLLQGSGRSPLRALGGQAPAHLLRVPLKPEGGGPWHFTESAWEE